MVGAAQALAHLALRLLDDAGAAVATDVEEGARGAVLAADDDDAVGAELAGDELARLVDGGDVADADPAAEDVVELPVEDRRDRRRRAGGSIVARSTGCERARDLARVEGQGCVGIEAFIDLVVNRMLVSAPMEVKSAAPTFRPPPRLRLRGGRVRRGAADLQARARGFAEDVLMPLEEEAEALGGRLPDGDDRRGQARGDRRRARRRHARGRARRPGLDAARVGAGRGAVRAHHQRDPLARAAGLQRLGAREPRSTSTATCARRCAASSRTPTRSPSATPAPTRPRSRRPPSAPTPAFGSTARSGSSPAATTPPSTS